MHFSNDLLYWYSQNKRDLPWRKTRDPYKIWLSEIILQQTRVNQGLPYFVRFLNEFPTIYDLAEASEDKVLKIWQGLGYYSRARNLQHTAKFICDNYDGEFPRNYNDILALKGIGSYTAAAISSFAFHKNYAVVDGNVIRVLSRFFGIETFYDTSKGKKEFQKLADSNLPKKKSHLYNQAIMEFGALICTPKTPSCISCCFSESCYAFNKRMIAEFPKKSKKIKVKNRFLCFMILEDDQSYCFVKKESGIWSGLYEFPSVEFSGNINIDQLIKNEKFISFFNGRKFNLNKISPQITHKLSHQKLHVRFIHFKLQELDFPNFKLVKKVGVNKLPVSKLIDNYLIKNNI